ncbi:MAG TPA: response regulator [Pyrinomonadaceae bacterium]
MLATSESLPVAIVAESDEETRGLIRSLLELLGFAVVEANDGEEVYQSAVCYHPHLILMELQLPAVNDVAAIRRIRRDSDLSKVPIIVTSSSKKKANQRLALAAGCTAHLAKPIEFDRLESVVENLVPCDRLSMVSFLIH